MPLPCPCRAPPAQSVDVQARTVLTQCTSISPPPWVASSSAVRLRTDACTTAPARARTVVAGTATMTSTTCRLQVGSYASLGTAEAARAHAARGHYREECFRPSIFELNSYKPLQKIDKRFLLINFCSDPLKPVTRY